MRTINEKLKQLRTEKGLTGEEVAKLLGKSGNHVISRIESGETKLSLEVFDKLCRIYEVSPATLFSEDRPLNKRKGFFDRVSYRADEVQLSMELKEKLSPFLKELRKIGNLQKKLGKVPFDYKEINKIGLDENLPLKNKKEIAKGLAQSLRARLSIDQEDELDIVDLISNKLNIPILSTDLGESLWGFYSKDVYGFPLIVLNENSKFEGRKRFTLAHELGHYFLHNEYMEIDFDGEKADGERMVDSFAQELLVPTDYFRRYFDEVGFSLVDKIKPSHVAMLANKFKVSFLMIAYLLADSQKITWDEYKKLDQYCKEKLAEEKDVIGYMTPDYVVRIKPLKSKLMELALEAKAKRVIGMDELSKITEMDFEELAKVM